MSKYFLKVQCPHSHIEESYINPEYIIKVFKIKKYPTSIQFLDDGSRDDGGESNGNYINDERTVNEVISEIEKVMEARRGLIRHIGNDMHEYIVDTATGEMKRSYHD